MFFRVFFFGTINGTGNRFDPGRLNSLESMSTEDVGEPCLQVDCVSRFARTDPSTRISTHEYECLCHSCL